VPLPAAHRERGNATGLPARRRLGARYMARIGFHALELARRIALGLSGRRCISVAWRTELAESVGSARVVAHLEVGGRDAAVCVGSAA